MYLLLISYHSYFSTKSSIPSTYWCPSTSPPSLLIFHHLFSSIPVQAAYPLNNIFFVCSSTYPFIFLLISFYWLVFPTVTTFCLLAAIVLLFSYWFVMYLLFEKLMSHLILLPCPTPFLFSRRIYHVVDIQQEFLQIKRIQTKWTGNKSKNWSMINKELLNLIL